MSRTLTPEAQSKLATWSLFAAPVALLAAVAALITAILGIVRTPEPPDVRAEVDQIDAVKDFGEDYMTLWLAGKGDKHEDSPHVKRLQEMTSAPVELELPPTAYRVENLSVRVTDDEDLGLGDHAYRIRAKAVVIPPGAQQAGTRTFDLDVVSHEGTNFQTTALPRQVSETEIPFEALSAYSQEADGRSPMFAAAKSFAAAYLTPGGADGELGSTVGPDFEGHAVADPLWDSVTVLGVNYYADDEDFDPQQAQEGDTVHALITAQGSSSSTTFSTVQLPVEMIVLSNGSWGVNRFEPYVAIRDIEESH